MWLQIQSQDSKSFPKNFENHKKTPKYVILESAQKRTTAEDEMGGHMEMVYHCEHYKGRCQKIFDIVITLSHFSTNLMDNNLD